MGISILNTLSATFGQEVAYLFEEMGIAAAVLLCLGLVLIIIEIFTPGFGFFGISGIVLFLIGIVLSATADGQGSPLIRVLLLLVILIIVCIIAFILMALSLKKGWISRTPLVMKEKAVSEGVAEGTVDYSGLLGKEGVVLSTLRPSGIAEIDGVRYDVVTEGAFIEVDKKIFVDKVEGVRIVVKEIK